MKTVVRFVKLAHYGQITQLSLLMTNVLQRALTADGKLVINVNIVRQLLTQTHRNILPVVRRTVVYSHVAYVVIRTVFNVKKIMNVFNL